MDEQSGAGETEEERGESASERIEERRAASGA